MDTIKNDLDKLGTKIVSDAKKSAPVKTGKLKKSLGYETIFVSNDSFNLTLTEVEYGVYVNNGTKNQKAQPFMSNAIEKNIDNGIESIVSTLTDDVLGDLFKNEK